MTDHPRSTTRNDDIDSTQSSTVTDPTTPDSTTIAFVCVQNAGRSQMATAYAERERDRRGWDDRIEIVSGGTEPAESVHDVVVAAMAVDGFDLEERRPRAITPDELDACDIVCTMGCSADGICPATWRGDDRDWDLPDPHGKSIDAVHEIREEVRERVVALFDELEA